MKKGNPKVDPYNCIIIKGGMPRLIEGNSYSLTAEYVPDPKWGDQYNIISIYSLLTSNKEDKNGQQKFLLSLYTELQVHNMYKALEDPFEALQNGDAAKLVTVKGCGMDTAARWINKFKENIFVGKIFTELDELNLTNNMVKRLLERYKSPDLVIEKIKNNPYILCNEVKGIGWKTADKIALESGIDKNSSKRIGAFIIHYLDERAKNGNSWITPDELMGGIIEQLGDEVPDDNITTAIYELEQVLWWNDNKTQIGLKKYYIIEGKIAEELIRIRNAENKFTYENWQDTVKHVENRQRWSFTSEQIEGVEQALNNNVLLIHGEAGTGKTSLVAALLEILKKYSYAQCALSGRASSRMAEVTGEEGYTIHRLLGYPCNDDSIGKNGFLFHDENPLPQDIFILDEISMVDAFLFYNLLRAIPDGAKLICLGDMGQLESIGCGNIAYDIIHSPEIPTVYLSQIHRQAATSAIITEARKIRKGEQIVAEEWVGIETRGELQDLTINCYSDKSNTFYKIMQAFSKAMEDKHFNIMENQILVPKKTNGDSCAWNINNTVQELYNPYDKNKKEVKVKSKEGVTILREGDKVINIQNNYKTDPPIYNGNIGIIEEICPEDNSVLISFNGIGKVCLEGHSLQCIKLGYAITIHKSQGSQFDHVILGIDFSSYSLLKRELLYTGITRAKKKCDLIAQTGALRMAVNQEGVSVKQTHLQQCLQYVAHPKLIF